MSLDTLFQHILLTEQQLSKHTQKLKEVKVAIIRCNEKLKSASEKYEKTSAELNEKAQQLSSIRQQQDLMKKCEGQMLKQVEDMLCQKSSFSERLAKIKKGSKEEEEKFLQEITRFKSAFSLCGNRDDVFVRQTHTEILDLEREVQSLYKGIQKVKKERHQTDKNQFFEMELMSDGSSHISSLLEEKEVLKSELQNLENNLKDLDRQLRDAKEMTESLKEEILFISQKPLTDNTCVKLRKELEMYKEEELELLRVTLSSEIQYLQSKLGSSQGSEQQ